MKITKTEIKNNIEGKDPVATYYGGLAGLGLEVYEIDSSEEIIYFVRYNGKTVNHVLSNLINPYCAANIIIYLQE